MTSIFRRRLLTSTLFLTAAIAAAPAMAQVTEPAEAAPEAQAEPGQDVVVTGSRIARPDLETASPVNVVGQQEIQLRQATTAEALLRDLPSVRPSIGPAVNNGGTGAATINLRGLGDNRTLVLLDSRRVVPFGLDGVTDTNVIPVALVERVDLVTGGASSVYGADAVAGVVNFITKRDFSGVDLSTNYRVSERGDATRFSADLTVGTNLSDGRGNAVLSVGYQRSNPLLVTSRDIGRIPISSTTGYFSGSTAAVPTIFTSPAATAFGFPGTSAGAVINPTTGRFEAATAGNTYNTNINTYFQTPLEKYNVFASARHNVFNDVEVYAQGMFTRSLVTIQLASSASFTNTYQLSLNNAYLPAAARNQLCAARGIAQATCDTAAAVRGGPGTAGYVEIPVIAQRRFTEYGPRGNPVESTQFQVVTGLRGNLTNTLKFDLSAQYGETTQNQTRENWGSFSRLQQSLRSFRNAAGTPTCADTANGCVPINLFGAEGSITPAMLGFIDLDALIRRHTDQTVVTGSISGDLFGLTSPFSASPVAFSIGAEYRDIFAYSQPDSASQIQGEVLGTGARTPPDIGGYKVKEAFGELIVPLITDKPFFHNLTLEAGARYSDYSTTGDSFTWKAGGSFEPIQGFKFRGMYQVAVRSPNISELYQGVVQGLGNLTTDPCAGSAPVGNAGLTALCIATGAPAGTIGSIPQPSSTQINVTTSGNPNLGVEKAKTYTLGAVLTPRFVPGFSATFDYFNIKVRDAISSPAQGDILNGCYSSALNPSFANNGFCQLIGRNPLNGSLNGAGETPGVILAGSNLGVIETAGIDAGVSYRTRLTDDVQLNLGFNGTWLDYYHFQATSNSINRDCTGYYSTNCTNPRPEWKWNTRATLSAGGFDVSLLWTHLSAVRLERYLATAITPLSTPQPGGPNPALSGSATLVLNGQTLTVPTAGIQEAFRRIPAYNYFDLATRYSVGDNLEFTLTVDNLLDKDPPLVGSGVGGTSFNNGNTFPTTYDPIGRRFTVGVRLKL
ncbi:TonB-dependent receptor [Sphingomonas sp. Leaf33]|uniref:TonB-dependent receptor domain-containing protein n=1 Tax=Sphingomonas sp. Leaf33 TaxID=1736215 RepID=UPI000701B967|nr:TonB-dependent receptor [Sphingomonas sp. Leaf33]KQN25821.1 TonB-dependent receptor [Sphingomonas sp. Leaf33]